MGHLEDKKSKMSTRIDNKASGKGSDGQGGHAPIAGSAKDLSNPDGSVDADKLTHGGSLEDVANALQGNGSLLGASPYLQKKAKEPIPDGVYSAVHGKDIHDAVMGSVDQFTGLIHAVALPDRISSDPKSGIRLALKEMFEVLEELEALLTTGLGGSNEGDEGDEGVADGDAAPAAHGAGQSEEE